MATLARQEYRSALRSRVLVALIVAIVLVTAGSITIGSFDFKARVSDYTAYAAQATAAGVPLNAPPQYFPLQLLRGVIEYFEIIGAVIGIGLGYLAVARERSGGTLPLLLSRPVRQRDLFLGRLLGASAVLTTISGVAAAISIVLIGVVGGVWIGGVDLVRVAITFSGAILYMLLFYALGSWLCGRSRVVANGLVGALAIWLSIVLIIPQIGDTMDPDNQVPGGLFAALQVKKPDERRVLARFSTYETIRTSLEETSLTKHFERYTFAITGIKDTYNGKPISMVTAEKHGDLGWIAGYTALLTALMWTGLTRERTIRQES